MAVRAVCRQTPDNFKVIAAADSLAEYTLRLLCNEKIFPKRSRWLIAGKIADLVNDYQTAVHTANEMRVESTLAFSFRREQQLEALAYLRALDAKVSLAHAVLHIDANRLEYWAGLMNENEKLIKAWMRSDKKRYSGEVAE